MKKNSFICLFCFFFSISLFSYESNMFDFSVGTGLLNGRINEYVFYSGNDNSDVKESQLDWDVLTIPYAEAEFKFTFNNFFIALSGAIGLPKNSGKMQDYDWLNSNNIEELTNYSVHTNQLKEYYKGSAVMGVNFYPIYELKLTPFYSFKFENIFFDGLEGYKKYKSNGWIEKEFSGKVISYRQVMEAINVGFAFSYFAFHRIEFCLSGSVSPYLTYINGYDFHWINKDSGGTLYNDRLYSGLKFNGAFDIFYKISSNHKVGLKSSLEYADIIKGSTQTKNLDSNGEIISESWRSITGKGGSSRFLYNASLVYKFSIK